MKKRILSIVGLMLVVLACLKVPITNRKQVNLLPERDMIAMSEVEYNKFLKNHTVDTVSERAKMVKSVGDKIAKAVEVYMKKHHHSKRIQGFKWEFNLVEDKQVNAWCMPGGKVCFYTGILDITKDEDGLAVVMGHEIAHAIARHGNERMSHGLLVQMGGVALNVAVAEKSDEVRALYNNAYGIGAGLGVVLPFSRKNELEADKLGLVFMQLAGYDAKKAISFWKRMAKVGPNVPEFMSTHPSDLKRVQEIELFLASPDFKAHSKK